MRIQVRGWVIPATIGVASFGAGFLAGHLFTRYKFKFEVEDAKAEEEDFESQITQLQFCFEEHGRELNHVLQQTNRVVNELKDYSKKFVENLPTPESFIMDSRNSHPSNTSAQEEETLTVNVFPVIDNDWDYEEELKTRSPDHPYIIHRDEYFSNEEDYRQSSLTYYQGDNILCDEQDVPVYNPEKVVGKIEFGKGSLDPNICYIRNDHLEAEYEILMDFGSFQEEVLGQQQVKDIKHSRVLKFRNDD